MSLSIPISRVAFGGDGVGRLPDGKVCFVPGALPGETVLVELVRQAKSFARARLVRVEVPSPDRIEPDCPLAGTCPGCVYRHAAPACELEWKNTQFRDFLTRGNPSGEAIRFLPPVQAPRRSGYRNKLTFVCENGAFCYRGLDNQTAVPIPDCLLGHDDLRALLASAKPSADGRKRTFRRTDRDGALDSGTSAWVRVPYLTETLGGFGEFRVPKTSFFQVNTDMAPVLAGRVIELLQSLAPGMLLELYCGVGVFSVLAAEAVPELTARAVELDRGAIEAAEANAAAHGVSARCTFMAADAARAFATLSDGCDPRRCCVLADPPRTGMAASLLHEIGRFAPESVLYVSCAPDTLRRDADLLSQYGYRAATAGMLDMFPGTAHFESVTVFRRAS